ncbi:tRNA-2-methylthio-N6-dimethylallyladenosine synthase [Ruminococcus sp. YE71]|uniref:tRNA (N6-isopentenyl adenosine(37)-C2)-methylthiotransferase MiaB n=1 Tax=unclassified Ruminococcus TaxID=2608920 RepID=UPI00088853D1|nr:MULTISPECIES: tRNA (N6-isopentenyl adenosine(37)-C2)-methylthiotransferase MiaB [unclassified Ruminococcus]SDA13726.1 tRNA-2-methylthio-N6-dimethylallyladenosine synthase [Ruminococcus sp. YE78]SFW19555.1 tRNA-2-methylthio-N6-dimethylallyladenosine synthase [Ruminococcus sp. YE71]
MKIQTDFSGEERQQEGLVFLRQYTASHAEKFGVPPLCMVHSFGCQQNVSDGERLLGALSEAGFEPTEDYRLAQLIIFNTCAVRENAEDKVRGVLGDLKKFKEQRPDVILGICGCMAQEEKSAKKLLETYGQIDLIFGTFATGELYAMLAEVIRSRTRIFNIEEKPSDPDAPFTQLRKSSFSAFLPIMYGCNNFCTYCIVPYVRGRERSRSPESVEAEVRELVGKGYKEIFLLGQNVNSYSYGFPALLRRLNAIEGDFRIRFMSSHPKDATNELIDAILECDKVCKHLHLALQSGSDRVLRAMNRRYTHEDYMKIVDYAREKRPDFSFSTDIIVGFPGETYEEFCETKEFVKRVKFDNIYSFVYSPRSGTKAAELDDPVSEKQKGLWLRELLLENREVASEWMRRFVGKTCRVLVDGKGKEDGTLTGKNDENIIVNFAGDESLIGGFCDVKITDAMNWAVKGELV